MEARRALIARYASRREEFVARGMEQARSLVPELLPAGDAEAERMLADAFAGNFDNAVAQVRLNQASDAPAGGPRAIQAVAGARYAARSGIALSALIRVYRIALGISTEFLAEEIALLDIDAQLRATLGRLAAQMQFVYNDDLMELVGREYRDERDRIMRGRQLRLDATVAQVLGGDGAAGVRQELGYDVSGPHVGAVVRGPGAGAFARRLGGDLGAERLIVEKADELAWLWLALDTAPDRRRLEALAAGGPVSLALGAPARGPEGFRATHGQACAADRIASRSGEAVVAYRDVAVLAAVLADPVARDGLVAVSLGELAGDDDRSATLRGTLRAYFATGQNAASAAARLAVHEKTVRDRLRTIEQLIGPIAGQRAELEMALALQELEAHGDD